MEYITGVKLHISGGAFFISAAAAPQADVREMRSSTHVSLSSPSLLLSLSPPFFLFPFLPSHSLPLSYFTVCFFLSSATLSPLPLSCHSLCSLSLSLSLIPHGTLS